MNFIPELVPFNFIKSETIDYKTVFPNRSNTQKEVNSSIPTWRQIFPVETSIIFYVWTQNNVEPSITVSGVTMEQAISPQTTDSDYYLWNIEVYFTSLGLGTLSLNTSEVYSSNTFRVVDNLQDDITQYHLMEFSHFKNDFDYWFVNTDESQNYFKVWFEANNTPSSVSSEINTYEDDYNDSEVTFSTANDSISMTIPAVDRWFSRLFNHISVCSKLRVDGIDYSPESVVNVEAVEDNLNRFNVELLLKENN